MPEQQEKKSFLKRVGEVVSSIGGNLTLILTIFSGVAAALFLRERGKRLNAEMDVELKDTAVKVDVAKDKAKEAENEAMEAGRKADTSYSDYQRAKDSYDRSGN